MEAVATQYNNIAGNEVINTDGEQLQGVKNVTFPNRNKMGLFVGKKRARKEMKPKEERKSKCVKVDGKVGPSDKTVKILIKGSQAQSKATSTTQYVYQLLNVKHSFLNTK